MLISYLVDIMVFIKDNPPPATIILISGDRDFAYLLSTIRWRKYQVVLISNSFMTHESLTAQASAVYDWQSDILKTQPPSKPLPLRSTRETSSVVFLTASKEFRGSPAPGVHLAGPPEEHVHPLAFSPRSVSITTINTVRPLHATLPPDIPLVESDATPIPTKAEIPAEAVFANVPTTPTSDDWIVADLTSECAMVLLLAFTLSPLA